MSPTNNPYGAVQETEVGGPIPDIRYPAWFTGRMIEGRREIGFTAAVLRALIDHGNGADGHGGGLRYGPGPVPGEVIFVDVAGSGHERQLHSIVAPTVEHIAGVLYVPPGRMWDERPIEPVIITNQVELDAAMEHRGRLGLDLSDSFARIRIDAPADGQPLRLYGERLPLVEVVGQSQLEVAGPIRVRAFHGTRVEARNARVWAVHDAKVHASGSTTVTAYDRAVIRATGHATVRAHENASVWAMDKAKVAAADRAWVMARHQVRVTAQDDSYVSASGSARVEARGRTRVTAAGSAHVIARDWVRVIANDRASVQAEHHVRVEKCSPLATVCGGLISDHAAPGPPVPRDGMGMGL